MALEWRKRREAKRLARALGYDPRRASFRPSVRRDRGWLTVIRDGEANLYLLSFNPRNWLTGYTHALKFPADHEGNIPYAVLAPLEMDAAPMVAEHFYWQGDEHNAR